MRRALYWFVPVTASLLGAIAFGAGFFSYIRGDVGEPVSVALRPLQSNAPRGIVVPVVLGDSLARGAGDETGLGIGGRFVAELRRRHISTNNATNLAVNGAKTADVLQQLQSRGVRAVIAQSNVVILSIGGNDLNWRPGSPRNPTQVMTATADRVERIVKTIRAANPTARIFVIGLYNPYANLPNGRYITALVNRWNAMLTERFSADPNVVLVETYDIFAFRDRLSYDHFHPRDEGYELIARRIADAI